MSITVRIYVKRERTTVIIGFRILRNTFVFFLELSPFLFRWSGHLNYEITVI